MASLPQDWELIILLSQDKKKRLFSHRLNYVIISRKQKADVLR